MDISDFERHVAATRSAGTARNYKYSVNRLYEFMDTLGIENLGAVPPNFLNSFVNWLAPSFEPATVRRHVAGVQSYLKWLERHCNYQVPELHTPDLPRLKTKIKSALPPELFQSYFETANAHLEEPERSMVMLLPCCGLRVAEMCKLPLKGSLRRTPLKFSDGSTRDTLTMLVQGKGGDERFVPILNEGSEVLRQYLGGWRRHHGDPYWMFPGAFQDEPISQRQIHRSVQKVTAKMGLRCSPHTLRRTYLTHLWRMGVDFATIAKIAGHKDPKILFKHYLDMNAQDLAEAVHSQGGSLKEH